MASFKTLWQVVGGAAKGGLLVRAEKDSCTQEACGRLALNAVVVAIEHDVEKGRMRYEKVTGKGPEAGWISTAYKGKELLIATGDEVSTEAGSTTASLDAFSEDLSDCEAFEQRAARTLRAYCARFGQVEFEEEPEEEASSQDEADTDSQPSQSSTTRQDEAEDLAGVRSGDGSSSSSRSHVPVEEEAPPEFHTGIRVRIKGLRSKPQLNGQEATLLDSDGTGRWKVSLPGGDSANLQEKFLEPVQPLPRRQPPPSKKQPVVEEVSEAKEVKATPPVKQKMSKAVEEKASKMEKHLAALDSLLAKEDAAKQSLLKRREAAVAPRRPAPAVVHETEEEGEPGEDGDTARAVTHRRLRDIALTESRKFDDVRARLHRELRSKKRQAKPGRPAPSPGVQVCCKCGIAVGRFACSSKDGPIHRDCMEQQLLRELHNAEQEYERVKAAAKLARREEFDIGWRPAEHIPSNLSLLGRLCPMLPEGMCCIVFQEETNTVALAPTAEPAAAVNLEYLSIALEVRRRENREPVFSLDPVDAGSEFYDPKQSMQAKRFEPAWLAGTSVGEVLFQSDYHLKELSMGEFDQPVVGMQSCHEYSEEDSPEWNAREWFVVRKAEVHLSGDNVFLPQVKLGVEAREQVLGSEGLEDVRTTKPNHPLVKYAEAFSRNFDLIAERRSVVYHLRELAKATVLAKFLVESGVELDETWFDVAQGRKEACCLEIPQLWNDRWSAQVRVQDGQLVRTNAKDSHSLYGGVQFGLDKFQLSGTRQPARAVSAGLAARHFIQPARQLAASLQAGVATRQFQRSFGPLGVQPARAAAGVGMERLSLTGAARQPARGLAAGIAARQFVQPVRNLGATVSAGLATRQFQRSFGPMAVQPAVAAGVGLDKFAVSTARQPTRAMSAGLAARQFVQPARHMSTTLSAGLATRQFQRSFGPMMAQPARITAVGVEKVALSGARGPARMLSTALSARQFLQPSRQLSATLSAGLVARQFQRSFGVEVAAPAPAAPAPAAPAAAVGAERAAVAPARAPARLVSAGVAARQFVQPAGRLLAATLSSGMATRQFPRTIGPSGIQPARVAAAGLGLEKVGLAGVRQPPRMLSAGLAARQFAQPSRHLSGTLSAGLATKQFQRSFGPVGVQPARVAGVDLNLEEFNLSAPSAEGEFEDSHVQLHGGANMSAAFWADLLGQAPSLFGKEDRDLLKKVFHPRLCDRLQEGGHFMPPDTSASYVQRLRELVMQEQAIQQERRDHFLGEAFIKADPGPLFAAWPSCKQERADCLLWPCPEYLEQRSAIEPSLKAATPVFSRQTEDGTAFRIYKLGALEVRSTQEHDGDEVIGAVYSSCPPLEEVC